jgi:hypothetical protein
MFASHNNVHVDLKPGSKWGAIRTVLEEHDAYKKYRLAPTEEGPSTPQEWAPVEAYMGLFELCEHQLTKNLIDEDTFESLYKYRLTNIMWNKVIVNQKIIGRASGWRRFNDLLDRFAIVKQVREPQEETIGPIEVAMSQQANEQNDNNHLDYEQTLATYRMLADIRFKLLAFIPVVSGIAIVLLTRDLKTVQESPQVALVLGLLGFFVTLGIAFYDQRNSRLHDATVGYARDLEHGRGHINRMRHTPRLKFFGIVEIWHDRALALIYGSVLGAWLVPVAYAAFIIVSKLSVDSSKMADLR